MPDQPPEPCEHERLIQSHQAQLRGYIFVICPNQSAMEDILQETNRVLWQKRDEFQAGTNFLAWARTIAQYQTLGFLKKHKSKSWLCFDSDLVQTLASETIDRDEARQSRSDALGECVRELPKNYADLIDMRYQMQMSLKEVSAKTGRPEGGLKQAFMRIRKMLRECVERKTVRDK